MAGDWIKMRTNLDTDWRVIEISVELGIPASRVVFWLYKLAGWFATHGKYGTFTDEVESVIDSYVDIEGFSDALKSVDWMRVENGRLILRGFTDISGTRKSLGKQIRSKVLANAVANGEQNPSCCLCGCSSQLEIDHIIPVSRGGTSDVSNLQVLCKPCNVRKGTKTMQEFEVKRD